MKFGILIGRSKFKPLGVNSVSRIQNLFQDRRIIVNSDVPVRGDSWQAIISFANQSQRFPVTRPQLSSLKSDYERIIRPIEQQMLRLVWRIVQHSDDADDALQEALGQIWQGLPRIRRHANPQALVLRICANVAWDSVRRKLRRSLGTQVLDIDAVETPMPDVAVLMLDSERRDQVKSAIARLPEHQAAAISMRFLLSCSYEEIALSLECAESTARVHVTRGLSRLRDLLLTSTPPPRWRLDHDN